MIRCRTFKSLVRFPKQVNEAVRLLTQLGIHGKPFIDWDDSGPRESNDWAGYCPHNVDKPFLSISSEANCLQEKLFVSWHRPFVLLFEVS
jgi:tyrosinase